VTITKGIGELELTPLPEQRDRRAGAGRPKLEISDPGLPELIESLVEPLTRGDPESPAAVDVQEYTLMDPLNRN
jgi:hypothetical protein